MRGCAFREFIDVLLRSFGLFDLLTGSFTSDIHFFNFSGDFMVKFSSVFVKDICFLSTKDAS